MAIIKKIEPRTIRFIEAYEKLESEKKLPSNVVLAGILGIKSKSTVSEILAKRQNIQPGSWAKFKRHFKIRESGDDSEDSVLITDMGTYTINNDKGNKSQHDSTANEDANELTSDQIVNVIQKLSNNNDRLLSQHDVMLKQHDRIIDTNSRIADTNRLLTEQLIKERSSSDSNQNISVDTVSTVLVLRGFVERLLSDATKEPIREIQQNFDKKVKEAKAAIESRGIHAGEGTEHRFSPGS